MAVMRVSRQVFLSDAQGKKFADVANDANQPFDFVLKFFDDSDRQRRMHESEPHHARAPLDGIVRELEAQSVIERFLRGAEVRRNTRFRQAIEVLVRMIMKGKKWQKTGRQGSLATQAARSNHHPAHHMGGMAFWFVRAERYELADSMAYSSVRQRCQELKSSVPRRSIRCVVGIIQLSGQD